MDPQGRDLKLRMRGADVLQLQTELRQLGASIKDKDGFFGQSTRKAVIDFQTQRGLTPSGIMDARFRREINTALAQAGTLPATPPSTPKEPISPMPPGAAPPGALPTDPPTPQPPVANEPFGVHGEVVEADGTPLSNRTVRAFDRALCEWRRLGNAQTNDLGRYRIDYDQAQLKSWGKTRADLKVEVYDPAGATLLATSPIILQAQPAETVNFAISDEIYRGPDEYTRVDQALAPRLESHKDLGCLEVADIMILARQVKLANSRVAYYVKAHRWSMELNAPAALFYGLLRRDQPSQLDALFARPLSALWRELEAAKAQNIINAPLGAALRTRLAEIQQGYLTQQAHPYTRLLATTKLNPSQQTAFTQKLTSGDTTGDAFWKSLGTDAGFSAELVTDLKSAFDLQTFTAGNTSLTTQLRSGMKVGDPRQVAAFSVEAWRDTVLTGKGVEIPEDIPGAAEPDRRAAYAQLLYRSAELRYPTSSLAGQMARDTAWDQSTALGFLTRNPDFEFRDQRALPFLSQHPDALANFPDPKAARTDLLRVEQLFHLTPAEDKLAMIQPLWQAGLRSAPQIALLGRENLLRKAGGLDRKAAIGIYRQAVHITSVALNVYIRFNPRLNSLSLAALQMPQLPKAQALAHAASTLPDWQDLFGSADACECSDYASATSPAAYLVDMLAFLQRAVNSAGNNALDELLLRRPDLGALQLTQENTETELPHIDLVIEILEQIVASADGKTLSGNAIGPTTWDSAQLAAQPEYLVSGAYDALRTAVYPFDELPFDLWAEEGRRYLRQMGIARDDLMRAMPPKPGVRTLEIATETLGMTASEREIIRKPNTKPAELAAYWGVDITKRNLRAQLGKVETLLAQAHIDYDALLRLLNTRYLNSGRAISVGFGSTPCSLEAAVLLGADGAELADDPLRTFLDRLHRFLRLQRRLGWTEYEIDMAVTALAMADFNDENVPAKLADLKTLGGTPGLPVSELCSWWGNLDTYVFEDAVSSQYDAIFLNPAMFPDTYAGAGPDLRNRVFALGPDRSDLAIVSSTDTSLSHWLAMSDGVTPPGYTLQPDYAAYVQSATRLTSRDLLLLVETVLPKDATTGHVALNLANLSLLYRIGSLVRALKITVSDYLNLSRITGLVPLGAPGLKVSPVDSMDFCDLFLKVGQGNWSIQQLAYLLLHDADAVAALAPSGEDMDAWLTTLSPGFLGITDVPTAANNADLTAAVTQSLGSTLAVDGAVLYALLFTERVTIGNDLLAHLIVQANSGMNGLPVPTEDFHTVFGRLHKFALAWNGLKLDATHLEFVAGSGPHLGWTDIAALPWQEQAKVDFNGWLRLTEAAGLQDSLFTVEDSLFGLLEAAQAASTDSTSFVPADYLAQVSEWSAWPLADVSYLVGTGGFNLNLPSAMQDERPFVALRKAFDAFRRAGVSAEQAHSWTIAELGYAETQSIKQALSLSYPADGWLDVLAALQDELRPLKRDALLAHLLNTLGYEDSTEFYDHYLIDPDQAPCAKTSRIVEAHAAVQTFAQRILLNLESFAFTREDAEAMSWRKRYRLWQAAREVFLFPENWLYPEVRDNKSVFFQELEDGLMQDDVNLDTAESLYQEYLYKLHQVSGLEIMGVYQDEETNILHVFGRTKDIPLQYFYRRWEDQARWTPWERVGVDIQGDHLIPIVYNGRLYLFWPEFSVSDNPDWQTTSTVGESDPDRGDSLRSQISEYEERIAEIDNEIALLEDTPGVKSVEGLEKEKQDDENALADLKGQLDDLMNKPTVVLGDRYIVDLGIAWSEYRDGSWTTKAPSAEKHTYTTSDSLDRHFFTGWVGSDGILRITARINKLANGEGLEAYSKEGYIGYFYLDECHGVLSFNSLPAGDPLPEVSVTGYLPSFHSLYWGSPSFSVPYMELLVGDDEEKRRLLNTAAGSLYYCHQFGQGGSETSPFFYADSNRTGIYFVEPLPDVVLPIWPLGTTTIATSATSRSRLATPTAQQGTISSSTNSHYQGTNTGQIVDHSFPELPSGTLATQTSSLGTIIEQDSAPSVVAGEGVMNTGFRYLFTRFYHPYTCLFLKQVSKYGVDGLLNPDKEWDDDCQNLDRQLTPLETFDFQDTYAPTLDWVSQNFTSAELDEKIDFDHWSAYGSYNWELFFHVPLLIATRLMQNQLYDDARHWFHYIFDPTCTDGKGTKRFWKCKPFYQEQQSGEMETLQDLIEHGSSELEHQVEEWEEDPFQPHVIARLRITAYMQTTVMRYLDCLIAEADMLYTLSTREDTNEAAQLYLLAGEILGDRPTLLPAEEAAVLTPNLLLGRFMVILGAGLPFDPLDQLTSILPISLGGVPSSRSGLGKLAGFQAVNQTGGSLLPGGATAISAQGATGALDTLSLFCLPYNDTLYAYWDTVADRLFKIRNCMNIEGEVRQLPLFAPPIDPALLVRASAAGLDISTIIGGLYAPLPNYRFSYMLQKALEMCGEVRNLGGALLSALEKKDGEQISLLRSANELSLLQSVRDLKSKSVEEAQASWEGLQKSQESAQSRLEYYQSREISAKETEQLTELVTAHGLQQLSQGVNALASTLYLIPDTTAGMPPSSSFGGTYLGNAQNAWGQAMGYFSGQHVNKSARAEISAIRERRQEDWDFQATLAAKEIDQLDKQILAAEIRQQIAAADLENHDQQIEQTEAVEEFLKTKFTNQQLYSWMVSKVSSAYFQAYQVALQYARQAEEAFKNELGPEQAGVSFVTSLYWDSLKKGLLAGEQLHQDLRRMEQAYLAANRRELEITKPISLFQLDPIALLGLRETGSCDIHIPEVLFDMDFPGHYFRRLKAVRLTIPCVAGPYTNVSATLTLTGSWTRKNPNLADPNQPERDATILPQTAIATSTANQDSGLYELNFNDPRYLPFETAGAISSWRLELPGGIRPFDYDTIADVILHLSYSARDGGATLQADGGATFKQAVSDRLVSSLNDLKNLVAQSDVPLSRLFSLRQEFSTEWNRLLFPGDGKAQTVTLNLTKLYFPRWLDYLWQNVSAQPITLTIESAVVYLNPALDQSVNAAGVKFTLNGATPTDSNPPGLIQFDGMPGLSGGTINNATGVELTLSIGDSELRPEAWKDMYIFLSYRIDANK